MENEKWYIGIDFGTSYTYVEGYSDSIENETHRKCLASELYVESYLANEFNPYHGIPTILGINTESQYVIGKQAKDLPENNRLEGMKNILREEIPHPQLYKLLTDHEHCKIPEMFKNEKSIFYYCEKFFEKLMKQIFCKTKSDEDNRIELSKVDTIVIGLPGDKSQSYIDIVKPALKNVCKMIDKTINIDIYVVEEPILAGYAMIQEIQDDEKLFWENMEDETSEGDKATKKYLVADVGGGTIDFSFMEKEANNEIKIMRDTQDLPIVCGGAGPAGQDFSTILIDKFISKNWNNQIDDYLKEVEIVKENLSDENKVLVETEIECRHHAIDDNHWVFYDKANYEKYNDTGKKELQDNEYIIYRDEDDSENLSVDKQLNLINTKVIAFIEEFGLKEQAMEILFVGGATNMPEICETIKSTVMQYCNVINSDKPNIFQLKKKNINKANAIAVGACLFAKNPLVSTISSWYLKYNKENIQITTGAEKYDEDGKFITHYDTRLAPTGGRLYFGLAQRKGWTRNTDNTIQTNKKGKYTPLLKSYPNQGGFWFAMNDQDEYFIQLIIYANADFDIRMSTRRPLKGIELSDDESLYIRKNDKIVKNPKKGYIS
ncbi:MAG: hypothetical protein LBT30_02185 [Clostridiales bacterium]|jgi:molecular chaperone DnaK (HSP70)|nr:hypothetical protein [Clostridiales bacterium]